MNSESIYLPILLFILAVALYFVPTLLAVYRYHPNWGSIFVLNIFLGWTGLGWVVALAMACSSVKRASTA
jgi:hypothetical protein